MLELEYDELIWGDAYEAICYAYHKGLPIIHDYHQRCHFFDFVEDERGVKYNKQKLLSNLRFHMSMAGLLPFGEKKFWSRRNAKDYHSDITMLSLESVFKAEIKVKKLIEYGRVDIPIKKCVIDWVDLQRVGPVKIDTLFTEDDWMKEVYFYPKPHVDGTRPYVRDIAVVSYINEGEVDSFENSFVPMRHKLLEIFEEVGIRGRKNGTQKSGKPDILKPRMERVLRETTPIEIINVRGAMKETKHPVLQKLKEKFGCPYAR